MGLRHHPHRGANVSGYSGTCSPVTGAAVSRDDVEFIASDAAREDAVVARLNYCYRAVGIAGSIQNPNLDK